jgi:preprotein translocase subunit SecA
MSFLTDDYRRTMIRQPEDLLTGLDAVLHSFVGSYKFNPGMIGEFLARAQEIDELAPGWTDLPDHLLRRKLLDFKEAFHRREKGYESLLPSALAAIREAAGRRVGLSPFTVQLAGALALYRGYGVEMATGEGKTLTAALACVLNGWSGHPCHVITVNDYLAGRDARWMGPLYDFCGVTVGCVTGDMEPEARRDGYNHAVTYTTNKEIVADFLRDRLWLGSFQQAERRQIAHLLGRSTNIERGLVMRGIHTAIVDEADSILIDEAVTPLIISRAFPNDVFTDACMVSNEIASDLQPEVDYRIDKRYKEIEINPRVKKELADRIRSSRAQFRGVGGHMELIQQALTAREFFHKDDQYVIQDGKVVIVDEFTGRQMPQRTWRAGLHQFIEAKEGLSMTTPTETLARLSFQRFYRLFHKLSGMTGTAREAIQELWDIYQLPVVTVPENRPCQRRLLPTRAFADLRSKWEAIVEEIVRLNRQGRPVLVGTRSVEASEHLASLVERTGTWYKVLNAVRHKEEAGIVSLAGERGAVTIATNMAGRGTDIRLGKGVAELGGLHVIASECHEAQRIDRQLFGRCARQGDPGSARLFISMEDEIVRRFVPEAVRNTIKGQLGARFFGARLAAAAAARLAQSAAQRLAYRRRRGVLRMDTWLEDSLSFARRDVS